MRSGKNLKTLREVLHEHDNKVEQSEILSSSVPYTMSVSGSKRGQFNISSNAQTRSTSKKDVRSRQSQKQFSKSEQKHSLYDTYIDSRTGAYLDRNSVKSRRALNTEFDKNLIQHGQYQSTSRDGHMYRRSYDETDSKPSRYSVRTVQTTVTKEFDEFEDDVAEKGEIEMTEKAAHEKNATTKHNVDLYGKF